MRAMSTVEEVSRSRHNCTARLCGRLKYLEVFELNHTLPSQALLQTLTMVTDSRCWNMHWATSAVTCGRSRRHRAPALSFLDVPR